MAVRGLTARSRPDGEQRYDSKEGPDSLQLLYTLQCISESFGFERFLQIADAANGMRFGAYCLIGDSRHEDNRKPRTSREQIPAQLDSGHARKVDIENEADSALGNPALKKFLRRRESTRRVPVRP